jgi:hypothetical protein
MLVLSVRIILVREKNNSHFGGEKDEKSNQTMFSGCSYPDIACHSRLAVGIQG